MADEDFYRLPDGRLHLVRVSTSVDNSGRVHIRSAGGQSSHQLAAMARADALAMLPDGTGIGAGETLRTMRLG